MGLFDSFTGRNKAEQKALEELREWYAGVSLGNSQEACHCLATKLNELTARIGGGEHLVASAEVLRPAIGDLLKRIWTEYASGGQSDSDRHQPALALARAALGAYSAACVKWKPASAADVPDWVVVAHFRAIIYLGAVIIHPYLHYRNPAEGLWKRLHQFYARSERLGFEDREVPDENRAAGGLVEATVANAYKRIVLFAAANPFQLMRKEARFLFEFLSQWVNECPLEKATLETDLLEHFFIDLSQDSKPRTVYDGLPGALENLRHIGIDPLLQRLNVPGSFSEHQREEHILRQAISQRLSMVLSFRPERKAERNADFGRINLVVGIHSAHHVSSGGAPFEPAGRARELQAHCANAGPHLDPSAMSGADAEELIRAMGAWADEEITLSSQGSGGTRANTPEKDVVEVGTPTLIDRGDSGLRLFVDKGLSTPPEVGELVAFCAGENAHAAWELGLVRWVRNADQGTHFGLKRFARSVAPAALRRDDGSSAPFQRALVVPGGDLRAPKTSLLVASGTFEPGDRLTVLSGDVLYLVRLQEVRALTQFVSQYSVTILDVCEPPPTE
ncbi:MAG: hypothetical protein ACPGU7_06205 [Gammaproteobacteria bacterium]